MAEKVNIDLEGMLSEVETAAGDNDGKTIIRELFGKIDKKQITLKTELDDAEIKLCTRIKAGADLLSAKISGKKGPKWITRHEIIDTFLCLRVSKNRQGRKELADALASGIEAQRAQRFPMTFFGGSQPQAVPVK